MPIGHAPSSRRLRPDGHWDCTVLRHFCSDRSITALRGRLKTAGVACHDVCTNPFETRIRMPSKHERTNPSNLSLYVKLASASRPSATASPSSRPSLLSERKYTPAVSRACAIFAASLSISPPSVRCGPRHASSRAPSTGASSGSGMIYPLSKNALSTIAHAPALTARAAGYDGCGGQPSGWV